MGIPYVLLKRDKPEAFILGKGAFHGRGWWEVFERRLNLMSSGDDLGNFLEPICGLEEGPLAARLEAFDQGYSGDAKEVSQRILTWLGDDVCFLSNCWEELCFMIEDGEDQSLISEEFADIQNVVCLPIANYRETGNIWGYEEPEHVRPIP